MTNQEKLALHKQLVDDCSRLLGGKPPEVQSAALAELLATWLGGWPQALRDSLLENHMKAVHELLPHVAVNDGQIVEVRKH